MTKRNDESMERRSLRDVVTGCLLPAIYQLCGRSTQWDESSIRDMVSTSISFPNNNNNNSNNGNKKAKKKTKTHNFQLGTGGTTSAPTSSSTATASATATVSAASDNIGGKPHDVEVRVALTMFHRLRQQSHSQKKAEATTSSLSSSSNSNPHSSTSVSSSIIITSDLGLTRDVSTPRQLAELLCPLVEDTVRSCPDFQMWFVPDVRVMVASSSTDPSSRGGGVLTMMTLERYKTLRMAGKRPCPHCTRWCEGEKGLWWHQQQHHGIEHSVASSLAVASSNDKAIVVYRGNGNSNSAGVQREVEDVDDDDGGDRNGNDDDCDPVDEGRGSSDNGVTGLNSRRRRSGIAGGTIADEMIEVLRWGADNNDNTILEGLKRAVASGQWNPATTLDRNGSTPLMWAAGSGKLDVVRYLIEDCGCNPHQPQKGKRSFAGRTALHWACRNGHVNVVRYLLEHGDHKVDVCAASPSLSLSSSSSSLTSLLEAATYDGTTAFGWACWQRHLDVMEYLHERGCNLHTINQFGCNAVLWCAQGTNDENDDDGNGDNEKGGSYGRTPSGNGTSKSRNNSNNGIIHARSRGLRALQWLERHGCNMALVNRNGHGVLHKAAQRGQWDVARWFVTDHLWWWQRQWDGIIVPHSQSGGATTVPSQRTYNNTMTVVATAEGGLAAGSPTQMTHTTPPTHTQQQQLHQNQLFALIGPDADGYCPSDLAGTEGHIDLARWLADEEVRICRTACGVDGMNLPWEVVVPPGYDGGDDMRWEPFGGVHRMRRSLNTRQTQVRN